jgi:hypothetical protein
MHIFFLLGQHHRLRHIYFYKHFEEGKMSGTNGNGNGSARVGTSTVKQGLAQMLKGGVIVSALKRR